MALYPGAKQRLIPKWNKVAITRYRRMNLHVAVSEADSLYGAFAGSNSACSHFYVNLNGDVEQYIDTRYRSAADMNGNDSTLSVETAGGVRNVNGEQWNAAQVAALVKLWAWARDTHSIPDKLATNTLTNDASSGLSWHRLGVKGNFKGREGIAATSYGGILYSSAAGKECPGDAKILQIPGIWQAARRDGGTAQTSPGKKPAVKPKPAAKTYRDLKRGSTGDDVRKVQQALRNEGYTKQIVDGVYGPQTAANVRDYQRLVGLVQDAVAGPITQKKLGL